MLGRFLQRFLLKRRIQDPVFGPLKADRNFRAWEGHVAIGPEDKEVFIWIHAGEEGPSPNQQKVFLDYRQRFAELHAAMTKPLFDEYQTRREIERTGYDLSVPTDQASYAAGFPEVRDLDDIWRIIHLRAIEVQGYYGVDICVHFAVDWADEEHELSVAITDGRVGEVAREG